MYKVLLIDDEEMALEYLKNLLDWEAYGFQIVGSVMSADKAKEVFCKELPEVVISDICMPGQSGLEFCEYILNINEATKIILLSAYQEFEYARKAINMGALDYILKYELTEELLAQKMNELLELLKKEDMERERKKRQKIYDFLNERYENDMEKGPKEWKEKGKQFALVLFREITGYEVLGQKWKKRQEKIYRLPEWKWEKLSEFESRYLKKVQSLALENGILFLLCSSEEPLGKRNVREEMEHVFIWIKENLENQTGRRYLAGYVTETHDMDKIPSLYKRIRSHMDAQNFEGKQELLQEPEITRSLPEEKSGDEIFCEIERIDDCLRNLDFKNAVREIRKLFGILDMTYDVFEHEMEICNRLLRLLLQWQNQYFYFKDKNNIPVWMRWKTVYSFREIEEEYIQKIQKAEKYLDDKNYAKYSYHVRKAVHFIKIHYMEDISVNDVADSIGVSDSYLSRLFKNETGNTVLGYLIQIRMTIAKQLLAETPYKVYEIAERVGYKTSQYFSELFTKETGVSPGAYRKKMRERDEI